MAMVHKLKYYLWQRYIYAYIVHRNLENIPFVFIKIFHHKRARRRSSRGRPSQCATDAKTM